MGGSRIAQNTNFNSIITPGNYYVETISDAETMTNIPREMAGTLKVEATSGSNVSYLRQIFSIYNSGEVEYRRGSTNKGSTWTDWVLVPTRIEMNNSYLLTGGTALAENTNIDTIFTPGNYGISSSGTARTMSGLPTTGNNIYAFNLKVENSAFNDTYARRQTLQYFNDTFKYVRYGTASNNSWNDWVKQPTRSEVDALNSKTDISVIQNSEQDKFRITTKYCKKIGNLLCLNIEVVTNSTIQASDGFVPIATLGVSTIPDTRFTVIDHWGHNVQCTAMLYQSSLRVYCPKETAANENFLVCVTVPL